MGDEEKSNKIFKWEIIYPQKINCWLCEKLVNLELRPKRGNINTKGMWNIEGNLV